MDIFTADDNGKRGGEGDEVHCPIRMKKEQIQSHRGNGYQLNGRNFPDNRKAVEQHQRRHDQNTDNLPFSRPVFQLLNSF